MVGVEVPIKSFSEELKKIVSTPKVILANPDAGFTKTLRQAVLGATSLLFRDHRPCKCNRCKEG
jgi:hypothetical protein